jgi:hypothetical protein
MAISTKTFDNLGGAVADIFAAMGDKAEAGLYTQAAAFAEQNKQFTKESTALKEFQQQRQAYNAIGAQQADAAGAGFGAGRNRARSPAREHASGRAGASNAVHAGHHPGNRL